MNRSILNASRTSEAEDEEEEDQDAFFDMLSRVQADRLDDQRCTMPKERVLVNPCSSSSLQKPLLQSKGSFNSHRQSPSLSGDKENKDKKSKTLPARANSLPAPGYSKAKGVEKSTRRTLTSFISIFLNQS